MANASRASTGNGSSREQALPAGLWLLLSTAFVGAALLVYEPALSGPFLSDDIHYIQSNFYVHELSFDHFLAILDPLGPVTKSVVNYSPAQLMIHSFAWAAFGPETPGHHVVNICFHALASLLLIPLLIRTGVPRIAAVLGGAFFLLHPANVEAVAWISQLKSSSSLAFSLAALLVFPRKPALGTLLFALSLLAKPTAAVALPVAALFAWTERDRIAKGWWLSWCVIFVVFAVFEFAVHQRSGAAEATLYSTPFDLLMTIVGLALRYLVMGATSIGVSAFQEPEPIRSLLDPWWLCALPVLALLAWRVVLVWRRRQPEVAWWVWAVVSFGPISQIFPFLHPLADRYLYFILPGLIGGSLLFSKELFERLAAPEPRRTARRVAAVAGAAVCIAMAVHSHQRAGIWRYAATLLADAAENYPDGVSANLIRSKRASGEGDAVAAAEALQAAADRGFNRFDMVVNDPRFDPVRNEPVFRAVVDAMAADKIARVESRKHPTQAELRLAAHAHFTRREYAQAREKLQQALEVEGVFDQQIREDLQGLATVLE